MEIIIQGKPISGSKISTSNIESSLVDRIYKDFFEKMGGVRTSHALIVDTIYWQNSWYSIYTYSRYSGITDTADRQSYFALSIVVPKNFLYLTSGVYHLLQKVYKEKIEGVYISKAGKYLVSDFSDTKSFKAIATYIDTEFANSNLEDPIDNEFQKNRTANIPVYNLSDCDSIAFLQDLKENGRVIVGEGSEFPKKCSASVIQSKEQKIGELNAKLSEQSNTIEQLKKDVENANKQAQSSANNCSATVGKLKAEIEQLKKEKDQAESQISAKQKELDDLVQNIQALVPNSQRKPIVEGNVVVNQEKSLLDRILDNIPFVNCLLLIVVCLCILFLRPSSPNPDYYEIVELRKENDWLKKEIQKKDSKLQELIQERGEELAPEQSIPVTTMDIDCNVQISTTDNKLIRSNDVIPNETIVEINWTPQEGYAWHATPNLDNNVLAELQKNNQTGRAIVTFKRSNSSTIILSYRADDPDGDKTHRNPKNTFIIK